MKHVSLCVHLCVCVKDISANQQTNKYSSKWILIIILCDVVHLTDGIENHKFYRIMRAQNMHVDLSVSWLLHVLCCASSYHQHDSASTEEGETRGEQTQFLKHK